MFISKQLEEMAMAEFDNSFFGIPDPGQEAAQLRRILSMVGDLVPESLEDENLKRDLYEHGKALLAEADAKAGLK